MTDYKQLCAELVAAWDATADFDYNDFGNAVADLVDRTRAALAEPEPEGPTDEELVKAVKAALDDYRYVTELPYFLSEDSSEYEPFMLAIRAAIAVERARSALAGPGPEEPTDDELFDLADAYAEYNGLIGLHNALDFARAVLAHFGNHPESPDSSTQPR